MIRFRKILSNVSLLFYSFYTLWMQGKAKHSLHFVLHSIRSTLRRLFFFYGEMPLLISAKFSVAARVHGQIVS